MSTCATVLYEIIALFHGFSFPYRFDGGLHKPSPRLSIRFFLIDRDDKNVYGVDVVHLT
jgi:hypothetical protein